MPPEDTDTSVATEAAAETPAASDSASPPSDASAHDFLRAAFTNDGATASSEASDDHADDEPGEPAESGVKPGETEKPVSRRAAAAQATAEKLTELLAKVSELETKLTMGVQPQAVEAQPDPAQAELDALVGPEDEYRTLARRNNRGEYLDNEERDKLAMWQFRRDHAEPIATRERVMLLTQIANDVAKVVPSLPGVDPKTVMSAPSIGVMLQAAYKAGAAEQQKTIDSLTAELEGLRAKAAGATSGQAERGGRSASGAGSPLSNDADSMDFLRAAFKTEAASRR